MSKILVVDDDAIILEVYRRRLAQNGFEVETAPDGITALNRLREGKPDVVLLDLMMPRLDGFEVLKYVRSQSALQGTRMVVLSNAYFGGAERQAASAHADAVLLKSSCTPAVLIETIRQVLAQAAPKPAVAPRLAASQKDPEAAGNRRDFLKNAPTALATIGHLNDAFVKADTPQTQSVRLLDFYRKVHQLTGMAGLAGYEPIALLSSAFEALLLELHQNPASINPSILQTIASGLDFLRLLFSQADRLRAISAESYKTLVVDDDPVSSHALALALRHAHLEAAEFQDPLMALKKLEQQLYGLILLDIDMPGIDGLELCKRIRALPQYQKTPIIFVTSHSEFDTRIQTVLSGGNDLISKPVFPSELALKAVTHWLRSQLADPA